jgi:hypothetical protein
MYVSNYFSNFVTMRVPDEGYRQIRVMHTLIPLSTIFQLYRGSQFYRLRKPEDPEKSADLSQVTDKLLSHNVVHIHFQYTKYLGKKIFPFSNFILFRLTTMTFLQEKSE